MRIGKSDTWRSAGGDWYAPTNTINKNLFGYRTRVPYATNPGRSTPKKWVVQDSASRFAANVAAAIAPAIGAMRFPDWITRYRHAGAVNRIVVMSNCSATGLSVVWYQVLVSPTSVMMRPASCFPLLNAMAARMNSAMQKQIRKPCNGAPILCAVKRCCMPLALTQLCGCSSKTQLYPRNNGSEHDT